MSRTCATILPSSSTTASSEVATSTGAVVAPPLTVTVRSSGSAAAANSPSWLTPTSTSRPAAGAARDSVTVKRAVPPSSIGVASTAIVTVGSSSSRTATSASPGFPTA